MHHIEYYLNILRQADIDAEFSLPYLYLSLNERIRARDLLKGLKRPVIGINPGASYGSTKRWQPEKFAEVTRKIISELGGSVVIFGGQSEAGIAEEITSKFEISNFKFQILNMAGKNRPQRTVRPYIRVRHTSYKRLRANAYWLCCQNSFGSYIRFNRP